MGFADLFAPAARNAVITWHEQVMGSSRRGMIAEPVVTSLEAALAAGTVVRLHLRFVMEAVRQNDRQWLIGFEDVASRNAQLQEQGILDAEILGLMDSIDYGVLLLDAAGKIRMASDRFAQIMGLQARTILDFGTIDVLIGNIAGRCSHPAEAAAR